MTYGLPWVGSKSRYARWILSHIPKEPILVDLFAGGCAVTDAALERGQRVIACDRYAEALTLFDEILWYGAQMPPEPRTRQEMKDSGMLCRLLWSFGVNQDTLAGKDAQARAASRYRQACAIHTRPRAPGGWVRYYSGDSLSYEPPREPCVIYADPPYAGTSSYNRGYTGLPIAEASTRQVIARLKELGRPWIMSESSIPSGLEVVDSLPVAHAFRAQCAGRTEYLLTEPRWAGYFLQRLL